MISATSMASLILTTMLLVHQSYSLTSSMNREHFLKKLSSAATVWLLLPTVTHSLAASSASKGASLGATTTQRVAYKPLSIALNDFGVNIPVACWFPTSEHDLIGQTSSQSTTAMVDSQIQYKHRISIRRIGQLLAGWDFIPEFLSRDFSLSPTLQGLADGRNLPLPTTGPVILLAHGYLGSRFDMSHLAERLASAGFTCLAPEYSESLAASFEKVEGLTRKVINTELLATLTNEYKLKPSRFGIIGHSLGCGTVLETGDTAWARVCIAGFSRNRDGSPIAGNLLLISSTNDGAVQLTRMGGIEVISSSFAMLDETLLSKLPDLSLPNRVAIVFDRSTAPNHISFLSEGVNDAMIELLSPLLPLAKALTIPVLDFDRYQQSRDSVATASSYHPLVIEYLKQQMTDR
jgi:pimeloyl-ACP methyl ester carboxylesterase